MKGGREYYAQRVRYFTTSTSPGRAGPPEGLEEVARIRAEMDQIIAKVGFKGGLSPISWRSCAPIRSSTPKPPRS